MARQTLNALASASSAYLRSAMHQPIRWHEWGEEAFQNAQAENKPILLDVGAVWCHWCHVMDRESYDDPEVAQIVNEHFIAIKVDRDERPDVDSRYQAAVQAMSGQGGWPLTAFLTPDGKPFFGGTYFPPQDHWGRPGFKKILLAIAQAYREKHGDVVQSANAVMSAISQAEVFAEKSAGFDPAIADRIVDAAAKLFDVKNGGFGSAPKFPHPAVLDLVIDRYARTGESYLLTIITTTLERMARGGVYDQLAGGFHRYSVDERWVVPHFEKMSYDNSELLKNYVHAWQATRNPLFAEVARDILRWIEGWFSDTENGGYYASQDADIDLHDDGDYFTWTLGEVRQTLDDPEFEAVRLHYGLSEVGQMHHNPAKNVLHVAVSADQVAVQLQKSKERVASLLHSAKRKMYGARLQRPTPYVDKTIYVGWNALMISACLQAARALELDGTRRFALRSLDRILSEAWHPERGLKHVIAYSDPQAAHRELPGLLDDYAFAAQACLDAYETTSDLSYFHFAQRITEAMLTRFWDVAASGFFDSEPSAAGNGEALGALAARRKPFQDSPTPAGNPAAGIALLRLHSYTHREEYRQRAEETLEVFAGMAPQFGIFAGTYGLAALWLAKPYQQVIVVGNDESARRLARAALETFAANRIVLCLPDNEADAHALPPALAETIPKLPGLREGKTLAVVCSGLTCQPPVADPESLMRLLAKGQM